MAKWEQREAAKAEEKRGETIAELRGRMASDDTKVRKRDAEMTAHEAIQKGIGHRG